MSKLAAIITGLALASILVAAVSVRQGPRAGGEARPAKPVGPVPAAAARLEVPVSPKADRLPLPVMDQSKLFGQSAMGHAGRPWLLDVPNSGFDSRDGRQEQLAAPVAIERIAASVEAPPKPRADPVCGPRGRTWYTKANGWKYWRCTR